MEIILLAPLRFLVELKISLELANIPLLTTVKIDHMSHLHRQTAPLSPYCRKQIQDGNQFLHFRPNLPNSEITKRNPCDSNGGREPTP